MPELQTATGASAPSCVYLSPSDYAEGWFWLNQTTPYSLDRMAYMRPIFNCGARRIVLKCGRQVGKSVFLLCTDLTFMANHPGFGVLYGVPDETKLRTYSNQKMHNMLQASKEWRAKFLSGNDVLNNVLEKRLNNGSTMFMRNAANVGNFRAPSADKLDLDEVQDMISDVLEVAEHTLFASPFKIEMFSGTPGSFQTPLEGYWRESTQNEWLIPCQACAKTVKTGPEVFTDYFWNCIGIRNVTSQGLICSRCGRPIQATDGRWISFNSGRTMEGFRIPQPISPFADFEDISAKIEGPEARPLSIVNNEIFGLSYDSADRYFTITELQAACGEYRILTSLKEADKRMQALIKSRACIAGIDWGLNREGGGDTVLSIFLMVGPTDSRLIYAIKMPKVMGWDDQVLYIIDRLQEFGVRLVCADWGASGNRNVDIARAIGSKRIIQIEYVSSDSIIEKYEGEISLLRINRTQALSTFKSEVVSRKNITFPEWEDFSRFANDILVEGVDLTSAGKLRYDHPKGTQDDFLHACVYADIARKIVAGIPITDLVSRVGREGES